MLCYYTVRNYQSGQSDYRSQTAISMKVLENTTSMSFTINITDDNIAECDETFTLTLSVPSSPCGVVSGSVSTSVVMIRDDDGRRSVSDYVVLLLTNRCKVVI